MAKKGEPQQNENLKYLSLLLKGAKEIIICDPYFLNINKKINLDTFVEN
jgi:hypothetical protein